VAIGEYNPDGIETKTKIMLTGSGVKQFAQVTANHSLWSMLSPSLLESSAGAATVVEQESNWRKWPRRPWLCKQQTKNTRTKHKKHNVTHFLLR